MRRIVISVQNGLLAESISRMLESSGEFVLYRSAAGNRNSPEVDCSMYEAEILLMEVSYARGMSIENRLEEARLVRKEVPACKVVLLCDENTMPELAHEVVLAKKDGRIDGFFYSSVSGSYLIAALATI